jgi:hypothetical protein
VLSWLLLVVSAIAGWARSVAFDTERWVAIVGPLIEDPAVVRTISALGADEIGDALGIRGPVREALEPRLRRRIARVLETPAARTAWIRINVSAHRAAVALLRDEPTSEVGTDGTSVYLDTTPLILVALRRSEAILTDVSGRPIDVPRPAGADPAEARRRLEAAIDTDLANDFGRIVVFRSDRLPVIQRVTATADRAVIWIILLTIAVVALTIGISRTRRRTAIALGIGIVVSFAILFALINGGRDGFVAMVAPDAARGAVRSIVDRVADSLGTTIAIMVLVGIGLALVAFLAGRGRDTSRMV